MSKSADSPQGTISLLDDPKAITKRIKSAVTDSDNEVRFDPVDEARRVEPAPDPRRHQQPARSREVEAEYAGGGYGALKSAVADAVVEFVRPLQERYAELEPDPGRSRPDPRRRRRRGRGDRGAGHRAGARRRRPAAARPTHELPTDVPPDGVRYERQSPSARVRPRGVLQRRGVRHRHDAARGGHRDPERVGPRHSSMRSTTRTPRSSASSSASW